MASVIGIIQARLGSSRLPGKILAPIAGHPLLGVLTRRLRRSRVDEWWLATTCERDDDVTAAWGEQLGLRVLRGDTDDVLSRFTAILRTREPDWMLRVTADDPFMDGAFVDRLLAALESCEKEAELSGSRLPPLIEIADANPVFPLGFAPQLARAADVVASEREIPADAPYHRSHVLSFLRGRHEPVSIPPPADWPRRPEWRWTVDTSTDLAMTRAAFRAFGDGWAEIGYADMVACLDQHPDISAMNLGERQKTLEEG